MEEILKIPATNEMNGRKQEEMGMGMGAQWYGINTDLPVRPPPRSTAFLARHLPCRWFPEHMLYRSELMVRGQLLASITFLPRPFPPLCCVVSGPGAEQRI